MLDREFLWCGVQMLLDEEEELAQLCPSCRAGVEEKRCIGCGALRSQVEVNESFDMKEFYERGSVGC